MSKGFDFVALDQLRAELNKEILRIGGQYDLVSREDSVHAIRNTDDPTIRANAERTVLKADCFLEASKQCRDAVNRVWPRVVSLIRECNQP